MGQHTIQQLGFNTGRVGCGYFFADPDLTGSIDELRIYAGVLTANDVANGFQAGPDTLFTIGSAPKVKISIALSGSQPILSWPLGTLEHATELQAHGLQFQTPSRHTRLPHRHPNNSIAFASTREGVPWQAKRDAALVMADRVGFRLFAFNIRGMHIAT